VDLAVRKTTTAVADLAQWFVYMNVTRQIKIMPCMFNVLYHCALSLWQHKLKYSCAMCFAVLEAICKMLSNSSLYFSSPVICVALTTFPLVSPLYLSYSHIYAFFHVTFATLWKSIRAKHFLLASIASWNNIPLGTFSTKNQLFETKQYRSAFETAQQQSVTYSVSSLEKHIIFSKMCSLLRKENQAEM